MIKPSDDFLAVESPLGVRQCIVCGNHPALPRSRFCSKRCVVNFRFIASDPSPDEIAERCAEIRRTWTKPIEAARRRDMPPNAALNADAVYLDDPERIATPSRPDRHGHREDE